MRSYDVVSDVQQRDVVNVVLVDVGNGLVVRLGIDVVTGLTIPSINISNSVLEMANCAMEWDVMGVTLNQLECDAKYSVILYANVTQRAGPFLRINFESKP